VILILDAEGVDIGMTMLKLLGYTFLPPFRIPLRSAQTAKSTKPKARNHQNFHSSVLSKSFAERAKTKEMSTPKRFELLPTNGFDIRKLIRVKRLNHSARAPV
jgi:hypothetical protein